MTKKNKSTVDELLESLSTEEKKEFQNELQNLALSELILALMKRDQVSVRKLAKIADISPSVVQAMRSRNTKDFTMQSFFKVLRGLGCKKLMVEHNGELVSLDFNQMKR